MESKEKFHVTVAAVLTLDGLSFYLCTYVHGGFRSDMGNRYLKIIATYI